MKLIFTYFFVNFLRCRPAQDNKVVPWKFWTIIEFVVKVYVWLYDIIIGSPRVPEGDSMTDRASENIVFNPNQATEPYDIFLSYRHGEADQLTKDLYDTLRAVGQRVFLDNSEIPPGVSFENVFLPAASQATHFICLATHSYFNSDYCRREVAHSLRAGRNFIPVPVDGNWPEVKSMPWLVRIHKADVRGSGQGLSENLKSYLLAQIQQSPAPRNHEFHVDACIYLLQELGETEKTRIINRLDWLRNIPNRGMSSEDMISAIQREVGGNTTRIQELCTALAP